MGPILCTYVPIGPTYRTNRTDVVHVRADPTYRPNRADLVRVPANPANRTVRVSLRVARPAGGPPASGGHAGDEPVRSGVGVEPAGNDRVRQGGQAPTFAQAAHLFAQ